MEPTPATIEEAAAVPKSASSTYAIQLASREVGNAYDTPWLLPKHKIFISHSGRQKDFAEQLCEDLETHGYYPFFDKRNDSLPKGEKFPPLIFKAARECLLAIVLISEDFFTRTKWPMLELAAFVKAQENRKDLRILPVLLGQLTVEDLKNTAKWSGLWTEWGKQDHRLTCDVISEWEAAVQSLRSWNMISKNSYDGDVKLRKGIVGVISGTMPPDIRSDILHVQGRERLCKEVRSRFDRCPSTSRICENATILGVYGIGGAGKSTLCMIVAEYLRSEFLGRVCVVELGKEASSTVNLQRQVLRQLCRDDIDFLNKHINTENEGLNRLKERICRERVFLAIDNVSDDAASQNTAKSFLRLKFHPNSMVLVTSRSDDVLCRLLGIPEQSCMHCLSMTKEEALQILLKQVNLPFELLDTKQKQVLHQAVGLSFFQGYHPLALHLFGAQLGTDQSKWREIKLDLEWTTDREHPLFSKIETNYQRLPDQHTKDMFMDIALSRPECLRGIDDIICWLTDTMGLDVDRIKQKLGTLRVKSLLETWKIEDETFRIHDLYCVLAQRNASVGNDFPRFIYQTGGGVAPKVLLDNHQSRNIERAIFVDAKFEMLGLEECTNLKVLSTRRCEKLRALCIQRLAYLVSLEVAVCALESLDLSGLSNLRWLHIASCKDLMQLDASKVKHLQHVNVSKCSKLTDLNFKKCSRVKLVSFLYNDSLSHVNLGNGQSLESLTLWFCGSLTDVEIGGVAHLTTLKKRGCARLLAMQGGDIMCGDLQYMSLEKWGRLSPAFVKGLEVSASLRVLDIWNCCMSRLPDLRRCLCLKELRLCNVDVLLSLNADPRLSEVDVSLGEYAKIMGLSEEDLKLPKSLEVRIKSCKNLVIKEILWKVQGLRNLRLLSLQDVRVGWDWELYRPKLDENRWQHIQKCKTGAMLINEIVMMHLQLSDEEEWKTDARLTDNYKISMMHWQRLVDLQAECSNKLMRNERGVTGCLENIKCGLQVFLDGRNSSLSQLEHSIKAELERWKTGAKLPTFQQDLGGMFWRIMLESVITEGSPCWIVEQIILRTCSNCDSLCECLQQVLSKEWQQGEYFVGCIMELCQKSHVKAICGQLHFLTANRLTDIVQLHHGVLKIWERVIIEALHRHSLISKSMFNFKRQDTPALPRLEIFLQRLESLNVCRGWQGADELEKQELLQFAWEWLGECRMCLCLEQLKGYCRPKRKSKVRSTELELHLHEMQELVRCIELTLKVEMEKWREDTSLASSDIECSSELLTTSDLLDGGHDRCGSLIRCWKVRQWLKEAESCLSEHLMIKPQKGMPVVDEKRRMLNVGKLSSLCALTVDGGHGLKTKNESGIRGHGEIHVMSHNVMNLLFEEIWDDFCSKQILSLPSLTQL